MTIQEGEIVGAGVLAEQAETQLGVAFLQQNFVHAHGQPVQAAWGMQLPQQAGGSDDVLGCGDQQIGPVCLPPFLEKMQQLAACYWLLGIRNVQWQ